VAKGAFVPKREELAGDWRRLRNEELHILFSLLDVTMEVRGGKDGISWHVSQVGVMRNAYKILIGKPE